MKDWKIAEVVGIIGATAFAMTVVFLYGYSIPLHLSLFVYLTINDYLRLAVGWLAPTALAWVAGVVLDAVLRRTEHGMTEEEIQEKIAKGAHPRFWLAVRRGGLQAPYIVAALALGVNTFALVLPHFPKVISYQLWGIAGPLMWFRGVRWYERERRLVAEWTGVWRAWVWFFPAMLIFAFFRGLSIAEQVNLPPPANPTHVFVLGRPEPFAGRLLFNLDDYVLLRTNNGGQVVAVPKAQVSLIVEGR